jgi:hypothetical protein
LLVSVFVIVALHHLARLDVPYHRHETRFNIGAQAIFRNAAKRGRQNHG